MINDYNELYFNQLNQNTKCTNSASAYNAQAERNKELARLKKQQDDNKQNLLDKQHRDLIEQNNIQIELLTKNNQELVEQCEILKQEQIESDKRHKKDTLMSWLSFGLAVASLVVAIIAIII